MPYKKGHSGNPEGRPKGKKNKTTREIKEAFQLLIESNIHNFENWLNSIADENPVKAMEIIIKLTEYIVPKLNRTELYNEKDIEIVWEEVRTYESEKEQ